MLTKTTNLKRMLVQFIAETLAVRQVLKLLSWQDVGRGKNWRGRESASHFFFWSSVLLYLEFPIIYLRVLYYKEFLTGLLTFFSFFMPFQSIIHTAILVIFLKRINGTDWFSLLKVLLRFTIACYVYSKPSCHTHHLLWFGTYFPSISCALYPQPSCISLILRMPVHWIVARLQWKTTYRLLNNSQYYWTLTILQGAKDWAESLCVFSHLIFIQPCEV